MTLWMLFSFLGGVGLFLLGMNLMTEGLKIAAGDALRRILGFATQSRLRGLASGVLITGVVQSSSAVIFATIGFVNAGILGLGPAVSVIYGANLGTTVTTWLVSVVGLEFSLKAFALPFIGLGMLLRVLAKRGQLSALGSAIAGFGVFFLGLDVLTDLFRDTGPLFTPGAELEGVWVLGLYLLAGVAMTVVMQSSSAALAVILTAAAGGLIGLPGAAAMMIGANLGTTSTAVFAAIGATPNARRVAASHVIFNLVEATTLFLLFSVLLGLVQWLAALLGMGQSVAMTLALFHTTGKLIGLALMWPLTALMVDWLGRRFRPHESELARPYFLDQAVLSTPSLGLRAVDRELQRALLASGHLFSDVIGGQRQEAARLQHRSEELQTLLDAINEAAQGLSSQGLSEETATMLPQILRTTRYLEELSERAIELDDLARRLPPSCPVEKTASQRLSALARRLTLHSDEPQACREHFDLQYDQVKSQLLVAGAAGRIGNREMSNWLDYFSVLRRAVKLMSRAREHAVSLQQAFQPDLAEEQEASSES